MACLSDAVDPKWHAINGLLLSGDAILLLEGALQSAVHTINLCSLEQPMYNTIQCPATAASCSVACIVELSVSAVPLTALTCTNV
eukprot:5957-Heterococcus_DN1.PRE.1